MKTTGKILAAAFVAAIMCMTPLFVIEDADASLIEDMAGYSIRMDNPTDAELTQFEVNKNNEIMTPLIVLMPFFNTAIIGEGQNISAGSFVYEDGRGYKYSGDEATEITANKIVADGISVTFPYTGAGPVAKAASPGISDDQKAAVEAMNAYFGNAAIGDKLVITGDIRLEMTYVTVEEYGEINENMFIETKCTETAYMVEKYDLKIEVVKAGEETGKSVKFVCDVKGSDIDTDDFVYDAEIKDITLLTTGKKTTTNEKDLSGSASFAVDGKDYDLSVDDDPDEPVTTDIVAEYYMEERTSLVIGPTFKNAIANIPASTDNVSVGKEYSDAQSLSDSIKDDAMGKKSNLTMYIVIGAVAAVVVIGGIAAFVFLRRKG